MKGRSDMELPREERQALDYAVCDPDDLAALTAEVLPAEDWTVLEGQAAPPPVIPKYEEGG